MDIHKRDILFYSNFCEYCKNLLSLLIKKGVRESFVLVCVDRKELRIPKFIDRVPSILTSNKDLFTDDAIIRYIESKVQSVSQMQDEISPFMFGNALNSSQYTYLSSDGNGYETTGEVNSDMKQINNFVLLGQDQKIFAPLDKEAESKSNKFDSSMLDKYMDSRKNDDEHIKKLLNNAQNFGQS